MKKTLFILLVSFLSYNAFSQDTLYKKKPTISVNFMMNDYRTADLVRNNSVGTVLKNGSWSKISEMSPGLSVTYLQGLTNYIDFSATLAGSFPTYTFKNETVSSSSSNFLLEADASLNVKLLSDAYIVNPYLSAGVGASLYRSSYGAFMPFGLGVQFRLSEDTYLFTNAQYRLGITDKASNHFNYSIGFGAPLFGNK